MNLKMKQVGEFVHVVSAQPMTCFVFDFRSGEQVDASVPAWMSESVAAELNRRVRVAVTQWLRLGVEPRWTVRDEPEIAQGFHEVVEAAQDGAPEAGQAVEFMEGDRAEVETRDGWQEMDPGLAQLILDGEADAGDCVAYIEEA